MPFLRSMIRRPQLAAIILLVVLPSRARSEAPSELRGWLTPQKWVRDTDAPVLSLGAKGAFDDMHVFAPCVHREGSRFSLYFCGSRGRVAERVFRLGLATSADGVHFARSERNPVFGFADGERSVLTPTLLCGLDGTPLREEGKLRMWFSATRFTDGTGRHTLHETTSTDGFDWSEPSPPLLEGVYAPTVVKLTEGYRLWYADVSKSPWVICTAFSADGRAWRPAPQPVVTVDQAWERERLFYPTVVRADGVFLMWYGSYWAQARDKTALGFAASTDGVVWHKSPHNPVFRPDPARAWESHYTTSQSVMRLPDGTWRMWYASRKAPPFVNKYFAINSARWAGPVPEER